MTDPGWPGFTRLPAGPRLPVLAAVTLALAAGAAGRPTGAQAFARPGLPIVVQDDAHLQYVSAGRVRAEVGRLRALGVDRVRLTASWAALTRRPGGRSHPRFDAADPAAYEQARWRHLDTAVREANAAGLGVMIDIGFWAPRWAAAGPGPRFRARINTREYARFSRAVAVRYSGSFVPPAGAADPAEPSNVALPAAQSFELWNEPNHPAFLIPQWAGRKRRRVPVSPGAYRAMVAQAYPAIKSVRRQATVLIGNTSSRGGFGGPHDAVPPLRFLRALACVDAHLRPITRGACRHYRRLDGDGWAHHPYSLTGPPNQRPRRPDEVLVANVADLARTLDRLVARRRIAPGLRDIFLTEYGYETRALAHRPPVSESTQGRYLTWGEYLAWRVPTVRLFGQFLLRDQPPSAGVHSDSPQRPHGQFYSGLEHADGTPKLAARSFVAGLFARRLRSGRVLLWGRLRLGHGAVTVSIQAHVPGQPWRTVTTASRAGASARRSFLADGKDVFGRWARYAARVRFRVEYRRRDGSRGYGLPVPVIAAGGRRHA